jgi:hypothetical protein
MNYNRKLRRPVTQRRRAPIRTSILELMRELSNLTTDDNLVIAAMKSIFGAYDVRLAGAPVPLRLVNTDTPDWTFRKKSRRPKRSR